ncbi:MAG: TonB-dependent receptor [Acidobacteriota bacterium]
MSSTSRLFLGTALLACITTCNEAMGYNEGELSGVATDTYTGSVLAGAAVTVTSPALIGSSRTTSTSAEGHYRFASLPPGVYRLAITHQGYEPFEQAGLQVLINTPSVFDPVVRPVEAVAHVTVTVHESVIHPEETQLSLVLDNDLIAGLPIIGRSYQSMLLIPPGITEVDELPFGVRTYNEAVLNAHGAREQSNLFMFDGGLTNSPYNGNQALAFNPDAIDQVEVVSAALGAQYGRGDGGVFNFRSKSGGNELEGGFRFDLREDAFDRRGSGKGGFFHERDEGRVGFFERYYSGTLGGAFIKDRLWFFTSGLYLDRKDEMHFEGEPYPDQVARSEHYDLFGKLSYQITPAQQLVLSAHRAPYAIHNVRALPEAIGDINYGAGSGTGKFPPASYLMQETGSDLYQLHHTAVLLPTLFLQSLVSVASVAQERGPDSDAPEDSGLHGWEVDPWNNGIVYRGRAPYRWMNREQRSQFREDMTLQVDDAGGAHDVTFGLEYQLEMSRRQYRFDYYVFRDGVPFQRNFTSDDPRFAVSSSSHGRSYTLYAEDSWSPRAGLFLRAGLRGDYQEMELNAFGGDPQRLIEDPDATPDDAPTTIQRIEDFGLAPRLGLAWDLRGDGKNVLRAGASRYYVSWNGIVGAFPRAALSAENPDFDAGQPDGYFLYCNTDEYGNCIDEPRRLTLSFDPYFVDEGLRFPHTDELTLSFEREMHPEVAVSLTAIARRSSDLLQDVQINHYADPDEPKFHLRNRNWRNPILLQNHDSSRYGGLELLLRKRLSYRWQLMASWTYSRSRGQDSHDIGPTGSHALAPGDDERSVALAWDRTQMGKLDATVGPFGGVIAGASVRYLTGTAFQVHVPQFLDLNHNGLPDDGEVYVFGEAYHPGETRRNGDTLDIDLHVEKTFLLRTATLGVFAEVYNALNDHASVKGQAYMKAYDPNCDPSSGAPCTPPGYVEDTHERRFGRQFQLGLRIGF